VCWAALCERALGEKPEASSQKPESGAKKQEEAAAVSPFVRVDYCEKCWGEGKRPQASSGAVMFSHWKTVVPVPQEKKRLLVDDSVLVDLFQRMEGRTEPQEVRFRFVLALILMRKRLLKYEGMEGNSEFGIQNSELTADAQSAGSASAPPQEVWLMKLRGTEAPIKIVNPHLTAEQISEVSGQLSSILAEEV